MVSQVSCWGPSQGGGHRQGLVVEEGVACLGLCPGLALSSKPRSTKDLVGGAQVLTVSFILLLCQIGRGCWSGSLVGLMSKVVVAQIFGEAGGWAAPLALSQPPLLSSPPQPL